VYYAYISVSVGKHCCFISMLKLFSPEHTSAFPAFVEIVNTRMVKRMR